jgi:hypothetical protein
MGTDHKTRNEKTQASDRRDFLKTGLAAVAGMAAGYSLLSEAVAASQQVTTMRPIRARAIMVPTNLKYRVKSPNSRVFEPASQRELVKSISPLVNQLVEEAGMKIEPQKMAELQSAFEQRGMINVPGATAASVVLSVSGSVTVSF